MSNLNSETTKNVRQSENQSTLPLPNQDKHFDTEHLKKDIKGRSIRGGFVTMLAQGVVLVLQLSGMVVLVRLLSPIDFGLVAMVAVVTRFAISFKDMGLSMATVQKSEINHGQVSTLFWINISMGLLTTLVVAALAPVVSWFYAEPRLTAITLVLSTTFFLGALPIQHQALLRRQMRFRVLAFVRIISITVGVSTAILFACGNAGYWSLVFMQLAIVATTTIGIIAACRWRPGLPVKGSGVWPMLVFGGHITGFSILNFFSRNLDKILIGRICGDGMLGLYSKSYEILNVPIANLRSPMISVAVPALSRLQNNPDRYKHFYSQLLFVLAFISMPLITFLCICSKSVILLVLGDQWVAMNGIFKMLAVAGFMQTVAGTRGLVLISCGQTGRYLKWGIMASAMSICAIAIGVPWGALGVATALAIMWNLNLVPSLWYCFRYTPVTIGTFFKGICRSMAASFVMGAALFFFSFLIVSQSVFLQTFFSFLVGAVVFILVWVAIPGGVNELKRIYSFASFLIPQRSKS